MRLAGMANEREREREKESSTYFLSVNFHVFSFGEFLDLSAEDHAIHKSGTGL